MGPIGCPEIFVTNYQSVLCKIPEKQRSHLHLNVNLKSHILRMSKWSLIREDRCLFSFMFHITLVSHSLQLKEWM